MPESDDKKTKSKHVDPVVEDSDRRPSGSYVKHPIKTRSKDGFTVVLAVGHRLGKDDLSPEDVKRFTKSGKVEVLR